ncbi:hypothetical protein EDD21DRAFT_439816 [Dissophora ornata]|nr:hypothetical protein BGZ58_000831 [Dissophora ornata]KAI8606038.1 hypothetical protein EDD21DRAFT_439816 [Dissophora ornata]
MGSKKTQFAAGLSNSQFDDEDLEGQNFEGQTFGNQPPYAPVVDEGQTFEDLASSATGPSAATYPPVTHDGPRSDHYLATPYSPPSSLRPTPHNNNNNQRPSSHQGSFTSSSSVPPPQYTEIPEPTSLATIPHPSQQQQQLHHEQQPVPLHPPSSSEQAQPLIPTSTSQHQESNPSRPTQPGSYGTIIPPAAHRLATDSGNSEAARTTPPKSCGGKRCKSSLAPNACALSAFCLFIVFYFVLWKFAAPGDICASERLAKGTENSYEVPYSPHLNLSLELLDGIMGSVVVRETRSLSQKDIRVRFLRRSTLPKNLERMKITLKVNDDNSTAAFRVFLDPDNSEKGQMFAQKQCIMADAEIIYPRPTTEIKQLSVSTSDGNISVQFQDSLAVIDFLDLMTIDGSIIINEATVRRQADIKAVNGEVRGLLNTLEVVRVATRYGEIDLTVDTAPGPHGYLPGNLNVSLTSEKSPINLALTQRYQGYFSLHSGFKTPTFIPSTAYPDITWHTSNSKGKLKGWITDDGSKPLGSLPKISVKALAGPVAVIIVDPDSDNP